MAMTGAQQQVNQLLQHFGKRAGAALELQDGVCALYDPEGRQAAVVEAHGETDTVIVHCRLMDFREQSDPQLLQQMLMLNFEISAMRGTWLALDDEGLLRLCTIYALANASEQSFSDLLEGFVAHVAEVRSFIEERVAEFA